MTNHETCVPSSAFLVWAVGNLVPWLPTTVARQAGRRPLERLGACRGDRGQLVQLDLFLPSLPGELLRLLPLLFSPL